MAVEVAQHLGSLRAGSYNKQLAEAAVKYAPDGGALHFTRICLRGQA